MVVLTRSKARAKKTDTTIDTVAESSPSVDDKLYPSVGVTKTVNYLYLFFSCVIFGSFSLGYCINPINYESCCYSGYVRSWLESTELSWASPRDGWSYKPHPGMYTSWLDMPHARSIDESVYPIQESFDSSQAAGMNLEVYGGYNYSGMLPPLYSTSPRGGGNGGTYTSIFSFYPLMENNTKQIRI